MTPIRGLAAAVVLVGTAVGLASPATADLSGTYTLSVSNGRSYTWAITDCGSSCADIASTETQSDQAFGGQAQLSGNSWTLTVQRPDALVCESDGSTYAGTSTFTWDATTLSGSETTTLTAATDGPCGDTAGYVTDPGTFELTKIG